MRRERNVRFPPASVTVVSAVSAIPESNTRSMSRMTFAASMGGRTSARGVPRISVADRPRSEAATLFANKNRPALSSTEIAPLDASAMALSSASVKAGSRKSVPPQVTGPMYQERALRRRPHYTVGARRRAAHPIRAGRTPPTGVLAPRDWSRFIACPCHARWARRVLLIPRPAPQASPRSLSDARTRPCAREHQCVALHR